MSEQKRGALTRVLGAIHAELRRTADFEADRLAQETATREMRRARQANCGNCLYIEPASWDWMEDNARTRPCLQDWTGWCTAQTRAPTRKRGDPTERQFNAPPCGRYEARCWPDGSPVTTTCQTLSINPQEEDDDR
jgi:hypothetical protein